MALMIGQPIDARELELTTSAWPPGKFASLCDALSWAVSGQASQKLPDFTNRIYAKDGGIDAGWEIDLAGQVGSIPTPLLGRGWNVFQYKQRDLMAQDRKKIISGLKSTLRCALAEVAKSRQRNPDRYIVFINADLKSSEKSLIRESILVGYSENVQVHVEILGAAELAAFLNDQPHIRAAYFAQQAFKTWEEAYRTHRLQKLFGSNIDLVGREEELIRLKSFADDSRVKVVILSGGHDIGKSRLALEATKHRPYDVVLALDPRSMALSNYRSLCTDRKEVVCIVEDPEQDKVQSLVAEALTLPSLKLIITLPTSDGAPPVSYGVDDRFQTLNLEPLSRQNARILLKATGQPLDFDIEEWILDHSGGIPGVLLAAAAVGKDLRSQSQNFVLEVGKEFERRIKDELGAEQLKCAQLFSVLEHVGIAGSFKSELDLICELFSGGLTSGEALQGLTNLEKAGVAKLGGSFAEVSQPLFANYLVSQLLHERSKEMFALFARLTESGRLRFLRRLSEVKTAGVKEFWNAVFAADGLLGNLQKALNNAHLLPLVAATVPIQVLRVLEVGLSKTTRQERMAIGGDQRRQLMWALEQLLFRRKTAPNALLLVWLLAEAENENDGNNASGVFEECFRPLHPQMPLSLTDRIKIIHECTAQSKSIEGRLVAVKAIQGALRSRGVMMRHSSGFEHFDSIPAITFEELRTYSQNLIDVMFALAKEESKVGIAALSELPYLTAEFGIHACPARAIERFKELVTWIDSAKPSLDVSKLFGAMSFMRDALSEHLGKGDVPESRLNEVKAHIANLDLLKSDLENSHFSTRLRRWAGQWSYVDAELEDRYEGELEKLAAEAIGNPHNLTEELIQWLISPHCQRSHPFFFYLGKKDEKLMYRGRMEGLGKTRNGADAFSSYWDGWAQRDRTAAGSSLDELARTNGVAGESVILATAKIGADHHAVIRVIDQLNSGKVSGDYTAAILQCGGWLNELSDDDFYLLLNAIAGTDFTHAISAVRMFSMWRHLGRSLKGGLVDFAWRCIEYTPVLETSNDAYYIDQLAAYLSEQDPERGFQVLGRLLMQPERKDKWWDVLELHSAHFWKVLHAKDRRRLVAILLDSAQTNVIARIRISWRLKELIDQEGDKEVLLSFAKEKIEFARMIAEWMTTAKAGFWPLAFELVQMFPNDEILQSNLAVGIQQMDSGITGPLSSFYEARKEEVEQKLHDPSTPSSVKSWLHEMVDRLSSGISSHIIWEYDRDVDDLWKDIENENSPQRLWAIGRILKFADLKDIRRLLTVEDIEEALPEVDLPPKRRKMLEQAIPIWRHGK